MPFKAYNKGYLTKVYLVHSYFHINMDYCNIIVIPFKIILIYTQDNATYSIKCKKSNDTTIRAI